MRLKSFLIIMVLAGAVLPATAQRKKTARKPAKQTQVKTKTQPAKDTMKGATIEVIQSYKPELRQAPKPVIDPAMPPADTSTPSLSYQVPQQTLSYTYNSFPLRPLALGKDTTVVPYTDYVKIGAGNLSTFLLDAGIGRFRGEDYESAIHFNHISRFGRISDQKALSTGLLASGKLHRNDMEHAAYLDVRRDQYYYYGYNHSLFGYDMKSIRQTFTDFNLGFSTRNEGEGYMGLDYNPSIDFSLYGDRFHASERSFNLHVPVSYKLDSSITLQMGLHFLYDRFVHVTRGIRQNNNIFQLTPGVHFKNDIITGYAGLYPTFGKGGAAYLLPDANIGLMVPNTDISVSLGYKAQLMQNTYEQLSTKNPFMFNYYNDAYTIRQTRHDDLYVSAKTNIGTHIYAKAKLSHQQFRGLPLFVNDMFGDGKQFLIIYDDKVNAIVLEGTVRYQVANTFSIGLTPAFYNYYKKSYAHVWHEPTVRLKGDMNMQVLKDLNISAYLLYIDGLYALSGGISRKLSPVVDLGGAAEYDINERIAAFAQVNNLLNNKYQRWYGYQAFGFNLFAGIRLKF